jgi:uncharacterized membrane protein YhaH (DUF805 family)
MSFQEAVRVCLSKYVDFNGRARRSEYWWFVVFNAVATTVGSVIDAIIGTRSGNVGAIEVLVGLALILPGIAVGVRRLHDVSQSGWWLLLALVPFLGALVLILVFFIRDSHPANQYGPSPKGTPAAAG